MTTDVRPSNADRIWGQFTNALGGLAPDARAAFLLHQIFEASYNEIARLIGQPAEACRAHVEHAREHAIPLMQTLIEPKSESGQAAPK